MHARSKMIKPISTQTQTSGRQRVAAAGVMFALSFVAASAQSGTPTDQQAAKNVQSQGQPPQKPTIAPVLTSVTVTAEQETLTQVVATGSRLGLEPLQTPASIMTVTSDMLMTRGFAQIEDAVDSMPGVTSGGSPGDPSQFVSRGFVGDQVQLLRDGVYIGPSDMISRPQNSFNLQSVDMLKGPASVLYGQGSVGGTINVVTKAPTFDHRSFEGILSYGSFNTYNVGLGTGGSLGNKAAYRADFSFFSTDGYVQHSNPNTINGTGSIVYKLSDKAQVRVGLDAMADKLTSYFGTPIVSASFGTRPIQGLFTSTSGMVIDSRMRYLNYNTSDSFSRSQSFMPNISLDWQITPNLELSNQAYYYHANRRWQNAESYTFLAAGSSDGNGGFVTSNVIGRDRFHVYHTQNLPGDRLNLTYSKRFLGMNNKLSGGAEFYYIAFLRTRGFPDAQYADFVDPLNPLRGVYGNYPGEFPSKIAPTRITDTAGYFEDALDVTRHLKLVTGLRFENLFLNRKNYTSSGVFQPGSSFITTYHPVSFRVGAVYSLTSFLTAYGQFTTGKDPVGSNIFLVNAGQNFQLASSKQGELGLKSVFPHHMGDATLALYDIHRNNILTQTSQNIVTNVGSQNSKGIEFSTNINPVRHFSVNFNTAYTYARFGTFIDTNSGKVDSGNKPADVPANITNLFANYSTTGRLPLEIGAGFRFVGERYADNANATKLYNYTTVDVYGTYHLTERLALTGRGRNLTNKAYVQWADINYPSELIVGAPRSFEVSFTGRF